MNQLGESSIGLDRLVKLRWLEQTALLKLAGNDSVLIKSILQDSLKSNFRSSNIEVRGSVSKTITILNKVWINPPSEIESLRNTGLELLKSRSGANRILIHWGMVAAVYPFWCSVATHVGRLLRLQGSVSAVHVQRRVCEQYGERETVSRRTRYVLRSYVDWGVLSESSQKGTYISAPLLPIEDYELIAWLVASLLRSRSNKPGSLSEIIESPCLFPFQIISVRPESLRAISSSRLDFIYQGLNNDLVILRDQKENKI